MNLYGYVKDTNTWLDKLGLSGSPIIVIGEGQKGVDEATRLLCEQGYNAESMMYPKNQWRPPVKLRAGMPDAEFKQTVEWNKQWLKDKIAQGYKVVDIGGDGRIIPSEFYKAEQEAIKEMGVSKIKLKKFGNGETVAEMRARVGCH
jgi:hypothetical protein